jgi:butyryl-CoA dehydrogenase
MVLLSSVASGERRIGMNFDPTDEQRRWRDLARDFAQGAIRPRAAVLDREQMFPYDIIAEMARLGLMGLTLPEEYGGSGGDFVAYILALEEISRADTSVGITMEAHISRLRTSRCLRHHGAEG